MEKIVFITFFFSIMAGVLNYVMNVKVQTVQKSFEGIFVTLSANVL